MLRKTSDYGMRSQIKVNYSQETKGSDKADGAVSWLFFWTEMCINALSSCCYCHRKGKGSCAVPVASHFPLDKGWLSGIKHKSPNGWLVMELGTEQEK